MKTEFMNDLLYQNDLPQEVNRWVTRCIRCNLRIGKAVTDSISYADAELYPNINVILKLLLTLRVGYCACERSFAALRRIKTCCRALTLTEDRP